MSGAEFPLVDAEARQLAVETFDRRIRASSASSRAGSVIVLSVNRFKGA